MAVAAIVNGESGDKGRLTLKAVSEATATKSSDTKEEKDVEISPPSCVKSVSNAPLQELMTVYHQVSG